MKKISPKSLQKKCWELTRKIIIKRDGGLCVLCKKKGSDVDHLFSRRNKTIFYTLSNLSFLCKPCHFSKTYGQSDTSYRLFEFVKKREGNKFDYLLQEASRKTNPFKDFNKIWYLESIYENLKKEFDSSI